MINIHIDQKKTTSNHFCEAFKKGCGGRIVTQTTMGIWAGYGSPSLHDGLMKNIKAGFDFYYGDHAYFGRGVFFRVTKNAFQHSGKGAGDMERLKPFYEAEKPWRKGGKHILLCTQTHSYYERLGIPEWVQNTIRRIKKHTDRPIIVREKFTHTPFMEDLKNAHCLVCHSSNTAVEALMEGVPVITTGDCAASVMGLSDPVNIEHPYYPDGRMEWAAALAANQWTLEEIAAGQCWNQIK